MFLVKFFIVLLVEWQAFFRNWKNTLQNHHPPRQLWWEVTETLRLKVFWAPVLLTMTAGCWCWYEKDVEIFMHVAQCLYYTPYFSCWCRILITKEAKHLLPNFREKDTSDGYTWVSLISNHFITYVFPNSATSYVQYDMSVMYRKYENTH